MPVGKVESSGKVLDPFRKPVSRMRPFQSRVPRFQAMSDMSEDDGAPRGVARCDEGELVRS